MTEYVKEYQRWLTSDIFDEDTKAELRAITDQKEIEDRFYKQLSFGTGGMRGVIGAGTNRMNFYTVGKATQGLANYLNAQGLTGGVAIAYDSRRMSLEFARDTAAILAANGIKAYIFDGVRPTPQLSFAVRYLKTSAGIVITASHNPPEYNGYKVYSSDGGQIVPPADKLITESVRAVNDYSDVERITFEEGVSRGLITVLGEKIDKEYIAAVSGTALCPEVIREQASKLKIVYSPLNGTGKMPVLRILGEWGFEKVYVVAEQAEPDGNFPTLKYPNPEDPAAFTLALKMAKQVDADIVMATDPDADRLGIYVKDGNGDYMAFSGNMSGALICEYRLARMREKGLLPKDSRAGAVVTTIVSTDMAGDIAKDYGVTCMQVLTGFKYIGQKIREFESALAQSGGQYSAQTGAYKYLFGFEESYGCLTGDYARDKDAVSAVFALAEAACYYASKGLTLADAMHGLYERYGYYKEGLWSKTFGGAAGAKTMREMTARLRKNPPENVGGARVIKVRDYLSKLVTTPADGKSVAFSDGLPESDVLYFELDKGWCCVRPSGTEPKIKVYIGVKGETMQNAEDTLAAITQDFTLMVQSSD